MRVPAESSRDWWTSREAAKALKVHYGTLADWRVKGYGPPCTIVRGVCRYDKEKLKQWLVDLPPAELTPKPKEDLVAKVLMQAIVELHIGIQDYAVNVWEKSKREIEDIRSGKRERLPGAYNSSKGLLDEMLAWQKEIKDLEDLLCFWKLSNDEEEFDEALSKIQVECVHIDRLRHLRKEMS